jgi:hypothetical protein
LASKIQAHTRASFYEITSDLQRRGPNGVFGRQGRLAVDDPNPHGQGLLASLMAIFA